MEWVTQLRLSCRPNAHAHTHTYAGGRRALACVAGADVAGDGVAAGALGAGTCTAAAGTAGANDDAGDCDSEHRQGLGATRGKKSAGRGYSRQG